MLFRVLLAVRSARTQLSSSSCPAGQLRPCARSLRCDSVPCSSACMSAPGSGTSDARPRILPGPRSSLRWPSGAPCSAFVSSRTASWAAASAPTWYGAGAYVSWTVAQFGWPLVGAAPVTERWKIVTRHTKGRVVCTLGLPARRPHELPPARAAHCVFVVIHNAFAIEAHPLPPNSGSTRISTRSCPNVTTSQMCGSPMATCSAVSSR